jgi:hypothetical protein
MSRRMRFLLLSVVVAIPITAPAYGQTCEGTARSMTTETRHFNCSNPNNALTWNLNIVCMDACGQPWFEPGPQPGAVNGSCSSVTGFCTPPYQFKDHNSGRYAETSAFHTRIDDTDGVKKCKNGTQVITSGTCPCAPECLQESPTPIIQGCAPECGSPIVIDLDRGGFDFTDVAGGVTFDLDGDGEGERISWLAAGSGDGWLVLDRNGNGVIDNGSELFGNFTPQPPSAEPHGYLALAVYDQESSGGDGDGWITANDAVYPALRLWLDTNHDGVSQSHELIPLATLGIRAIGLDYVEAERRDRHGNRLRYSSLVRLEQGTTQSVDVFLLTD